MNYFTILSFYFFQYCYKFTLIKGTCTNQIHSLNKCQLREWTSHFLHTVLLDDKHTGV